MLLGLGWTQKEAADALGKSQAWVHQQKKKVEDTVKDGGPLALLAKTDPGGWPQPDEFESNAQYVHACLQHAAEVGDKAAQMKYLEMIFRYDLDVMEEVDAE